jgi:hypothetical protein
LTSTTKVSKKGINGMLWCFFNKKCIIKEKWPFL